MNLTAQNTAVVLDSTADFPEAAERFPNWRMVPLYVRFGDESYRDYVELGPHEFYERLRTSPTTPATSQPTPGDFAATYTELGGYDRISRSTSRSRSRERSRVRASRPRSSATRCARSTRARRRRRRRCSASRSSAGSSAARPTRRSTRSSTRFKENAAILFTVDTLEFLQRGGRIGRAAKFAGQLLHVKPILTIEDGEVIPLKRVRGAAKAFAEFQQQFVDSTFDTDHLRVGIAHADAPDRAEQLRKMVAGERPKAQIEIVTTLGAVVGTHAGPGTVGFFWFRTGGR